MPVLNHYLQQNLDTPARVLDGRAVIITPQDAVLHTLNEVGTFIWARANGSRTVEDILQELTQTYDVDNGQALQDARDFIQACVDKGLLHLVVEPSPVDLGPVLAGAQVP